MSGAERVRRGPSSLLLVMISPLVMIVSGPARATSAPPARARPRQRAGAERPRAAGERRRGHHHRSVVCAGGWRRTGSADRCRASSGTRSPGRAALEMIIDVEHAFPAIGDRAPAFDISSAWRRKGGWTHRRRRAGRTLGHLFGFLAFVLARLLDGPLRIPPWPWRFPPLCTAALSSSFASPPPTGTISVFAAFVAPRESRFPRLGRRRRIRRQSGARSRPVIEHEAAALPAPPAPKRTCPAPTGIRPTAARAATRKNAPGPMMHGRPPCARRLAGRCCSGKMEEVGSFCCPALPVPLESPSVARWVSYRAFVI